MLVRVLIKRHFKEGKSREIFALLNRFRSDAIKEVGYVSGETLFDFDDPLKFLVISTWNGVENWINWKENPIRKANEGLLEKYLEKPTEYETYVLGTYPHEK